MKISRLFANTLKSLEDRYEKEHHISYSRIRQSTLKDGKICLVSVK